MITRETAKKLIHDNGGKIFGAKFTKKNGDERTMQCRRGVSKHVKGEGLKYKPEDYNLINVFDMANDGHRMINIDTLNELTIGGTKHAVK
jgi:hypothetical protein